MLTMFLDNPVSRRTRVGATNPTAGSGVNPKDPSWCSVLLRQVGGANREKGRSRTRDATRACTPQPHAHDRALYTAGIG
jgi:hypothetical protein